MVLRREGQVVASKTVRLSSDDDAQTVAFTFTPDQTGRFVYTVGVPVFPDEAVTENNSRSFVLKVIRDRVRVLLVVGRPSWDERFLRGLLKQDANARSSHVRAAWSSSSTPRVTRRRCTTRGARRRCSGCSSGSRSSARLISLGRDAGRRAARRTATVPARLPARSDTHGRRSADDELVPRVRRHELRTRRATKSGCTCARTGRSSRSTCRCAGFPSWTPRRRHHLTDEASATARRVSSSSVSPSSGPSASRCRSSRVASSRATRHRRSGLAATPLGQTSTAGGLELTSRSLLALGRAVPRGGREIVSSAWVAESTAHKSRSTTGTTTATCGGFAEFGGLPLVLHDRARAAIASTSSPSSTGRRDHDDELPSQRRPRAERPAARRGPSERAGVGVQRRLAAEVGVEHARARLDAPVDARGRSAPPSTSPRRPGRSASLRAARKAGSHRSSLRPGCRRCRHAIRRAARSRRRELAAEADRLGGAARDPRDLLPRLLDGRRAVDAEHACAAAPARRSRRSSRPASSR